MCACKASILTGRARRGLFETSQNLVAEHLLSVSAPVATYLVVLGARSTACFCRVFSELRMPIFCHHTPPSCCHLHSERSTMHPPRTPAASDRYGARPLTQVPLRRARTRTTTTTTRYERRTSNVERRDARVTPNNARAHVAVRRHDRDRDNDSDHDRDRCGPPRRRASCTSCDAAPSLAMAVEVPAVTRRVKRAARHAHRASRARMRTSSPRIARIVTVSVPPRTTGTRALRRRSLARSIARAVWRWRWR